MPAFVTRRRFYNCQEGKGGRVWRKVEEEDEEERREGGTIKSARAAHDK